MASLAHPTHCSRGCNLAKCPTEDSVGGCRNQGNPGLPCPCTCLSLCQLPHSPMPGCGHPQRAEKPLWQGLNLGSVGGDPTPRPLQLRASPSHLTFKKQGQFCTSRREKAVLYRSGFAPESHYAAKGISQGCKTLSVHLMHFSTYRTI